jgi:hypothetical protein
MARATCRRAGSNSHQQKGVGLRHMSARGVGISDGGCLLESLHHSAKLETSTPGYIAERACREELLDDLAGMMTSPIQCTMDL